MHSFDKIRILLLISLRTAHIIPRENDIIIVLNFKLRKLKNNPNRIRIHYNLTRKLLCKN